jgi:hypothetical protein
MQGNALLNLTKAVFFSNFAKTFKVQKAQKWQTQFWNPHKKKQIKYYLL